MQQQSNEQVEQTEVATQQPEVQTAEDYFGYEAEHYEASTTEAPQDVQAKVNELVKQVTVGEDGKFVYPEGIDPVLKATVATEKKYRDTQAGYTKSQTANKELEAQVKALQEQLATSEQPLELTTDEQNRLDDLKYTDPSAWRLELNKLEDTHRATTSEQIEKITEEAKQQTEYDRRIELLTTFNEGRDIQLNDEVMANDLPPKFVTKLKEGKVSFEDFLTEVGEYMDKGRKVANPANPSLPSLHQASGGSVATKMETEPELDYSQLTL